MKFVGIIFVAVTAILIKESLCASSKRPVSQPGIVFPVENWDDCFVDEASTQAGLCKKPEECPEILKKWQKERIYPKTCYFIKKQQFICCPLEATKEVFTSTESFENIFSTNTPFPTQRPGNDNLDIFNTEPGIYTNEPENINEMTTTGRPSNIFLDKLNNKTTPSTERPSNIFLDKVNNKTTTSTERPSNIFLDNAAKTTSSQKPPFSIPDIFNTDKPAFVKRRSESECDLLQFDSADTKSPLPEPNELPFMAVLGSKSDIDIKIWYPCGGILISAKFVVTAAHCAYFGGETPSFVRLGDKNMTETQIKQFIMHPNYNHTTIYSDIALVELEQEVDNPTACLWSQHDLPVAKFIALGYGHTGFEITRPSELFKASLTVIDNSDCQGYYKLDNLLTIDIVDSLLCAGGVENAHKSCQGAAGGPLIMELGKVVYLVGITSFGWGCVDWPPSIYTRVPSYLDWIEPIVWPQIDVRFDRKQL